ncbi:hypothetical protein RHGRI_023972 [Rhododendron griersonianum]|uniref:Uncharacterized protein n=1 Tax=Rhododendron griersonianum TaxID=479676 RepID=A0AAV6J7U0_9ERIC|nr:hypothetical protein RHGRI_023972 [Rhododendron griersonianum]
MVTIATSPVPFDFCPSLAEVQSSSLNPNVSKQSSEFDTHSPKHANPSPARKLQQVFQQESERVVAGNRISGIIEKLEEEVRRSDSSFDIDAIAAKLKHMKQGWDEAEAREAGSNGDIQISVPADLYRFSTSMVNRPQLSRNPDLSEPDAQRDGLGAAGDEFRLGFSSRTRSWLTSGDRSPTRSWDLSRRRPTGEKP